MYQKREGRWAGRGVAWLAWGRATRAGQCACPLTARLAGACCTALGLREAT